MLPLWLVACGGNTASSPTPSQALPAPTPTHVATLVATYTPTPSQEASVANNGDMVEVHYTGTLDSGEQFDSSAGGDPLSFVVGSGQVIKGFDDAVLGMKVGDKKKIRIEVNQAYGPRQEELVFEVPRANAPPGLEAGDGVRLANGQPAVVTEVTPDHVRIDANHPLAGQALTFDLELVAVK
jgi:peptidylprolyl isomerase